MDKDNVVNFYQEKGDRISEKLLKLVVTEAQQKYDTCFGERAFTVLGLSILFGQMRAAQEHLDKEEFSLVYEQLNKDFTEVMAYFAKEVLCED